MRGSPVARNHQAVRPCVSGAGSAVSPATCWGPTAMTTARALSEPVSVAIRTPSAVSRSARAAVPDGSRRAGRRRAARAAPRAPSSPRGWSGARSARAGPATSSRAELHAAGLVGARPSALHERELHPSAARALAREAHRAERPAGAHQRRADVSASGPAPQGQRVGAAGRELLEHLSDVLRGVDGVLCGVIAHVRSVRPRRCAARAERAKARTVRCGPSSRAVVSRRPSPPVGRRPCRR